MQLAKGEGLGQAQYVAGFNWLN